MKKIASKKGHILIIEDDPISRNILSNIFENEGYTVSVGSDGVEGLEKILSEAPDLVILDVVLPRLSGFEVCRSVRKNRSASSIPILIITSLDRKENIIKGLKSGANDYIPKPFNPAEVLARAKVNLEQKFFLDKLKDRTSKFRLAYEVLETTTSLLDLKRILFVLVEKTAVALKAERCSIVVVENEWDEESSGMKGRVLVSHEDPNLHEISIDLSRYPEILKAFSTGEVVLVEDVATDPLMKDVREMVAPLGYQSILAAPLSFRGEVMGALLLRSARSGRSFSEEEIAIARVIAGASTNALKNASLYEALEDRTRRAEKLNEELLRTNQELERLSKVKSEFVSTVSHELRTPLTSIIGFSELMAEEQAGALTREQKEYTRQILRKGKDLLALINDILDTGRLDAGRIACRFRMVNLRDVMNNVLSSTRHVTGAKPLIQMELPDDLPEIEADPDKVAQILTNLTTNALKFSPGGSPVVISARLLEGRRENDKSDLVRISVTDQGIGITEENLEKVFERFFQIDQGAARSRTGAGLGLFISKSLVELHGGKIWVESIHGKGSTFHFTLSLSQA
ncbi:MAG: response regulator [Deltaproteobacteria bacterium]|nr:response regulator [Deltaproteobacteria bacterium]